MELPNGSRRTWLLPTALLVAAVAVAASIVVGPAFEGRPTLPFGVYVLVPAAVVAWALRGRVGGVIVLVLLAFLAVVSAPRIVSDLAGERGVLVALLRGIEIAGVGVATYASIGQVRQPATRETRPDRTRLPQILALLGLCAIGAELLLAYDETTGDPAAIAFALLLFGGLYGAPALLARELVRRFGGGWPSLLLLFAALGTAQACLIDQSMFAVDYQGYEGWAAGREGTFIPVLGISAANAYNFVGGHVIYSFAAPIALAEAWVPGRAREPWLGPVGTGIAAIAYLGTAAMVLSDPESHSASPMQLAGSIGVVVVFIAAALLLGRVRPSIPSTGTSRLPVWAVLSSVLIVALLTNFDGAETWPSVAFGVIATGLVGVAILVVIRWSGWSLRHSAAVALGFLLARGALAFTYFPLIGEVAAFPKYTHNVAMLAIVLAAGVLSFRSLPIYAARPPAGSEAFAGEDDPDASSR